VPTDWPLDRVQSFIVDAHELHQLETARVVAQQHAYFDVHLSQEERWQWVELSLLANRRALHSGLEQPTRALPQEFMLRTWAIRHLGANDQHPDRDPEQLAADTLGALSLTPPDAAALATDWHPLPTERIRELRHHKNVTAHLEELLEHLHRPSPVRDQLLSWVEVRHRLP
jgi:hypothetical protein